MEIKCTTLSALSVQKATYFFNDNLSGILKKTGGILRMDISIIKAEATNSDTGIKLGKTAPKVSIEFLNLRCPYCKKWFEESQHMLTTAVDTGILQRVIKLLDKEKESLQRGNVMHRFVRRTNAAATIADITKIFDTQDQWGNLSLSEVEEFAKNKLQLTEQNHLDEATAIVAEAKEANIKFVPTIIIGTHIFDESISEEELTKILNEA